MPFFTPFQSAIRSLASELKQRWAGENFAPNPAALPSSLASENLGIRGVWIPSTDCKVLTSKQRIAEAMNFIADTGFNTVFPVVWNRGFTAYPSQIMREQFGWEIDARYQGDRKSGSAGMPRSTLFPYTTLFRSTGFNTVFPVVWNRGFTAYPSQIMREQFGWEIDARYQGRDPLAELIVEANKIGLKVIPWFEYGFVSSYNLNGGHLLAKKPEWAARNCSGNLLKKNNFEWMNSLDPEVQEFLLGLMLEVAKNYPVNGVQGDDRIGLPAEGGYDEKTVKRYGEECGREPPSHCRERHWLHWRADIITEFVARVHRELKAINPDLLLSMSPSPYEWGLVEYLQDSKSWVDKKLVDMLHPQFYRRDFNAYKQLVDQLIGEQLSREQVQCVSPGKIGRASCR